MSDDFLSSWRKRRLAKLKRQLSEKSSEEEGPQVEARSARDVVIPLLKGRAVEVLGAAEAQFPDATAAIVAELARLVSEGQIRGSISGEALYALFRRLGLRVRLKTKIVFVEKGREKSLYQKLKGE